MRFESNFHVNDVWHSKHSRTVTVATTCPTHVKLITVVLNILRHGRDAALAKDKRGNKGLYGVREGACQLFAPMYNTM